MMYRRRARFRLRCASGLLKIPTFSLTKRSWSNLSNIPQQGGCIVAVNHLSEFDPLVVWHCMRDAGRWPRFLTKVSLLEVPVVGRFLYLVGCIPVHRGAADASSALNIAADAVRAGDCVVIYPEGTTPKEGDLWPRPGKTGVARLFLATGAPVVPLVTWGPQDVFDPRTRKWQLRQRTAVTAVAGPPLDLSKWAGTEPTETSLAEITEQVMAALHDLLAEVRGSADQLSRPGQGRGSGPDRLDLDAGAVARHVGDGDLVRVGNADSRRGSGADCPALATGSAPPGRRLRVGASGSATATARRRGPVLLVRRLRWQWSCGARLHPKARVRFAGVADSC